MTLAALTFPDCKIALDAAIENSGVRITRTSPGQAIRFRQRCYQFRKAIRKTGTNPEYAGLKLTLDGHDVVIELVSTELTITTIEGGEARPATPADPAPLSADERAILAGVHLNLDVKE